MLAILLDDAAPSLRTAADCAHAAARVVKQLGGNVGQQKTSTGGLDDSRADWGWIGRTFFTGDWSP